MSTLIDHTMRFFYEEAEEHLVVLERCLLSLKVDTQPTLETIEELFRTAHTLKGAAGLVKQKTISQIAHRLEDSFEVLHEEECALTSDNISNLLGVLDCTRRLLAATMDGRPEPTEAITEADVMLKSLGSEGEQGLPAMSNHPESAPCNEDREGNQPPERRVQGPGNVKIGTEQLELMMNLLGEITVTENHMVSQIGSLQRMKRDIDFSNNRLNNEISHFAERYGHTLPGQVKYTDNLISEFQELEFDRYDEFNLFTRKVEEITSDINEAMKAMNGFFNLFTGDIESVHGMIQQLKERISAARTVQVGDLFQRFTRTLRELTRETGKQLELIVSGDHTLIDREVFDGLYAPLLHILRNAASHGIETPAERIALGKPETGTIRLTAERRGGTVEITVIDDGRGIQLDKIRCCAEAKGFIETGAEITDHDLTQMIFRQGFSTSEHTDTHAGRGIGMSVVMDDLAALNGTVVLSSEVGQGTKVRLNLPLSLVIINVIQFRLGSQAFVIPTNLVNEILDLTPSEEIPSEVEVKGEMIPAIDLSAVMGIPRKTFQIRFALVTHCAGKQVALLVEEIISQEETVLRSLGPFLKNLPHLSGTSISGDGALRLVLNPTRILPDTPAAPILKGLKADKTGPKLRVLVVDDSLSVRKHAEFILRKNSIEVATANNGLEALEVLDNERIDFIITDLEMPLMHGYELLGELQRKHQLEDTPTAVLSSRASQVHQDKARSFGACDYLIKPFDEERLMALVRKHIITTNDSL